ncbi:MAG: GAF domain-containing protein [Thermoflexales bacterium]|nr:GAF domain-containing protein [Thermoflexales bacterium]
MTDMTFEEYKLLVESQVRALLDVVQYAALGQFDVPIEIPEGIDVLSELAVSIEIMIDETQTMLTEQQRARQELEEARRQLEIALEEVQATQQRYLQQEWKRYTAGAEASRSGYLRDSEREGPSTEAWLPAMTSAVQQASAIEESDEQTQSSTLAVPLRLQDEIIGVLGFSRDEAQTWRASDIAAVETIVGQVALALESQRLFDEQQQTRALLATRIQELDCLNDIGRKIDETPSVADFLEWVSERIPQAFQHPELCQVAIEFDGHLYGAAEAKNLPFQMVSSLSITGQASGKIYIAYTERHAFLNEESALLGDIGRRVSGYIENQRLVEATQARARREQTLREITAQVRGSANPDTIARIAVRELGAAVGRPTFVHLQPDQPAATGQAGPAEGGTQ